MNEICGILGSRYPLVQGVSDMTFIFSPNSLEEAWIGGNLASNTLPAGQITGMVADVRSVREIIEDMVKV